MKKNIKKENKKKIEDENIEVNDSNIEIEESYDFESLYKRAIADYQNLKRRCEEDKKNMMKFSNEVLITKLLTVVGDLEFAVSHSKDDGIAKIHQKLLSILGDDGLVTIDPKGEKFDSVEHEAVESVKGEEGKIIKVLQKGFKLNSKVIKPAIVAVGNGV